MPWAAEPRPAPSWMARVSSVQAEMATTQDGDHVRTHASPYALTPSHTLTHSRTHALMHTRTRALMHLRTHATHPPTRPPAHPTTIPRTPRAEAQAKARAQARTQTQEQAQGCIASSSLHPKACKQVFVCVLVCTTKEGKHQPW